MKAPIGILLLGMIFLTTGCIRHIFRGTEYVPQIEVQINQTPEQIDDYTPNGTYVPCRARIINYQTGSTINFSGGLAVHIKNYGTTGGQLNFSTTGVGAGTSTLNIILPEDGTWGNFYARGTANSTIDKDAIIELAENRDITSDIVLARKAMMVTASPPALPAAKVEIRIGATSTIDDYFTWSPQLCNIRITNPDDVAADINVTIRNLPSTNRLRFATESSLTTITETATNATINVTLPEDGAWVNFYAAGFFDPAAAVTNDRGSSRDKDAVMEVVQAANVLCREGVMVRIRKNANNLSTEERDRFLNALQKLDITHDKYQLFYDMHRNINDEYRFEMHSVPSGEGNNSFLPWHRAMCLHLERFLQSVDPSVAIPYWKYDIPAPNIFSQSFMGQDNNVSNAGFNVSNPLAGWVAPEVVSAGIIRNQRYDPLTQSPATPGIPGGGGPASIDANTLAVGNNFGDINNEAASMPFEFGSHGPAHLKSGQGASWIPDLDVAVRDPLFFLLHANVDRLWARWQWINDRFDPASANSYFPAGTFPAVAPFPDDVAEYADETMWPWNGKTGPGPVATPLNVRPATAPGGEGSFPRTVGFTFSPFSIPMVKAFVDARSDRLFTTPNPGFGFAYDDHDPFAP